jgi:hypothetical protein
VSAWPDKITGRTFLDEWSHFATRWYTRHGERVSGVEVSPKLFDAICDALREAGHESEILSDTVVRRVTAGGLTTITKRAT